MMFHAKMLPLSPTVAYCCFLWSKVKPQYQFLILHNFERNLSESKYQIVFDVVVVVVDH